MTLRLNGDNSGFTEIKAADTAGDNSIKLPAGNGSANELLKNGGTAGELEFASDVVVDSSDRLLVGTSTFVGTGGGAQLQVIQNDTGDLRTITMGSTAVDQKLHMGAFSSGVSYITWGGYYDSAWTTDDTANTLCIGAIQLTSQTTGSDIVFRTQTSANTSPADRIQIKSNGALALLNGCPGIDFSGIQTNAGGMSSETLDAYEEGTWTPSLSGASGVVYSGQTGYYLRIGGLVFVQGVISMSTAPTGGSNIHISLPFASATSKSVSINYLPMNRVDAFSPSNKPKTAGVYLNSVSLFFYTEAGNVYNYPSAFTTGVLSFAGCYSIT